MIRENVLKIEKRVSFACSKINRDSSSLSIVAVSKNRGPEQIAEAIQAGITDIGENRIQEALPKISQLSTIDYGSSKIKWHMIGHLQTNKVEEAVKNFELIHSVDSLHLALVIDKQAAKINKIQEILLEVKTSEEATKFGFSSEDTVLAFEKIADLKNIKIIGLMTIAPLVEDSEKARPYFKILKNLFDKINRLSTIDNRLSTISMGMSDDFEVAIEEGSTMIRIGRAIFEG